MVKPLQGGLAVLVFVLILSVWNWISSILPSSPSGHAQWIILLVAAIAALVVYYATTKQK